MALPTARMIPRGPVISAFFVPSAICALSKGLMSKMSTSTGNLPFCCLTHSHIPAIVRHAFSKLRTVRCFLRPTLFTYKSPSSLQQTNKENQSIVLVTGSILKLGKYPFSRRMRRCHNRHRNNNDDSAYGNPKHHKVIKVSTELESKTTVGNADDDEQYV